MMSKLKEFIEASTIEKLAYLEGQTLNASSLIRDGEAIELRQQLHNSIAHTAGVIAGLFTLTMEQGRVKLSPGAAIDRRGRLLLIDANHPGDLFENDDEQAEPKPKNEGELPRLHVWLRYREIQPSLHMSQEEMTRVIEVPEIAIQKVQSEDSQWTSTESRGDEVYLGVFSTEQFQHANSIKYIRGTYACGRTYVSAMGARVESHSGRTRVLLGPETERDSRRFAIGARAKTSEAYEDLITWETTGAVRLKTRCSISAIHPGRKQGTEQPPIQKAVFPSTVCVALPQVAVTLEDILEPFEIVRKFIELELPSVQMPSSSSRSSGDFHAFQYSILGRLNRMIDSITRAGRVGSIYDENHERMLLAKLTELMRKGDVVITTPLGTQNTLTPFVARKLLDQYFHPFLKPLGTEKQFGVVFSGVGSADSKIPAASMVLVESEIDKQKVRELRISILDPGNKNNQPRYRCSLGAATQCVHGPAQSEQTGIPRGILSILANNTVEVHDVLKVLRENGKPGLIVQTPPPNLPGTDPVAVKVIQEKFASSLVAKWAADKTSVAISGSVACTKSAIIKSIEIHVSIIQRNDATIPPTRFSQKTEEQLTQEAGAVEIGDLFDNVPLTTSKPFIVPVPNSTVPLRFNVLILGVNDESNIVQFQQDIDDVQEPDPILPLTA